MAENILGAGTRITVVAPSGGVTSGQFFNVGNAFGIALASAASGANVAMATGVECTLRKLNGASTSYAQGALLYWDATNSNVTISATSNRLIGVATVAGANADTTATVRLNPAFT
jgi:predicted RecA/RadA family phage recombinase